jgi:hypothetical protein
MNRRPLVLVLAGALLVFAVIWLMNQEWSAPNESNSASPAESSDEMVQPEVPALDEALTEPMIIRDLQPGTEEVPQPIKTRHSSLSGKLVLADGGTVDRFIWTVRLEGPGQSWPMNSLRLEPDGSFQAQDLEPGFYDASVERNGLALATVEQIAVVAQTESKDPRINPWKPEEGSREMRIQISGRPGRRGDTNVWAIEGQGTILGHARWVGDDWILQCAAGQAPDAVIIAPGFQPQRIPWQDGDVPITLEPGFKVELQATAAVKMDPAIKRGWFSIQPEFPLFGINPNQFAVGFSATDLAAGKVVSLNLPTVGSYNLRFDGDVNDGPGFMPLYQTMIQKGIQVSEPGSGASQVVVVLPNPLRNDPE